MKTIIVSLYISLVSFFHVGHMAEYYYQLKGNTIHLKFIIEKHELLSYQLSDTCDVKQLTALCTAKYINQNALIKINGKKLVFELVKSHTQKEHLIVELKSKIENTVIKNIRIDNHSFYEFNSKFKNRVLLDLGPFKKSYLLTKNKSSLHLK